MSPADMDKLPPNVRPGEPIGRDAYGNLAPLGRATFPRPPAGELLRYTETELRAAVEAEREACARVMDRFGELGGAIGSTGERGAEAIRARGKS